jgi:hypothetical protein
MAWQGEAMKRLPLFVFPLLAEPEWTADFGAASLGRQRPDYLRISSACVRNRNMQEAAVEVHGAMRKGALERPDVLLGARFKARMIGILAGS